MNSLTAARGTCLKCGRYVTTYTRKGDSTPRASGHDCYHGEIGTVREWKECAGSSQPVRAA